MHLEEVEPKLDHLHRVAEATYPLRPLYRVFLAVELGNLPAELACLAQVTHAEDCDLLYRIVTPEFHPQCDCNPTVHIRLSSQHLFVLPDGSVTTMSQN